MKEYKDDIKSIIEVLTFLLILISFKTINYPTLSYLFLSLWPIYWIYNLIIKFQYRKETKNHILFPTKNDEFHKTTSIILAALVIISSFLALIWTKKINQYEIIGFLVGILILLNGIFDLPKGKIKIENNKLIISELENPLDLRILKEIVIKKDEIIFTNIYDERIKIHNVKVDANYSKQIENGIKSMILETRIKITKSI